MNQPPLELPTAGKLKTMAYELAKAEGCTRCQAYEALAKTYGYKTYAAMRVAVLKNGLDLKAPV